METGDLVGYALAAIGLMTIGWAAWSAKTVGIDREVGNSVLLRLLKRADHNRARKLCSAAPGSYFDAVKAAIEAATATGSKDLAALDAIAGHAFEAKGVAVIARWRGIIERGLLGVLLVLGGAAFAISQGPIPVPHLVTSGVAALALCWFLYRRRDAQVSIDIARTEIVPAISKAIVDAVDLPARPDDTGPFRTLGLSKMRPMNAADTLRDNRCPVCGPTSTRAVEREGGKFTVLVCTGCGFTQEFADLTKLDG